MTINVSNTADCNKIIITVVPSNQSLGSQTNEIRISNGTNSFNYSFQGGATNTRVVNVSDFAEQANGIFVINYLENGQPALRTAALLSCDVLCCLAGKMNELLDCDCDCTKCADQLAEAQKIFLLLKTAEAEIATADAAGTIEQIQAVIDNAQKKYVTALDMCGGHCGCNC